MLAGRFSLALSARASFDIPAHAVLDSAQAGSLTPHPGVAPLGGRPTTETITTMIRTSRILTAFAGLAVLISQAAATFAADADHPVVILDTTAGPITLELDRKAAPISTENFLKYVDKGFYDGTLFHRVMPGFMIQGGGMTDAGGGALRDKREGLFPPIKNESSNGLSNKRGTLAMARTQALNSATAQFYINHADNTAAGEVDLDSGQYAVFGKVIDGMKVVDAIAKMPTSGDRKDARGNANVPLQTITIKSAKVKK